MSENEKQVAKNNKKKIVIIITVIFVLILLAVASVLIIKKVKQKQEYDSISITLKQESVEVNYGETIDTKSMLVSYTGGELLVEDNIDFNKCGEYVVTYLVTSENGFKKSKEVKVSVVDKVKPTITLNKDSVNLKLNEKIDLLAGVKAEDNYDKDITDKVTVIGEVDTTKEGKYEIKYEVKDSSNNISETKVRTYTVKKDPTLKTGKTYEWKNSSGGSRITLKANNKFEASSWANQGGAIDTKGTYKIKGNKLTLNITHRFELIGWEPSSFTEVYTITGDNQFKDSDGRVYKMK